MISNSTQIFIFFESGYLHYFVRQESREQFGGSRLNDVLNMARPRKHNTPEERRVAARQYRKAYYCRFELNHSFPH
jgi:hypothetical protein